MRKVGKLTQERDCDSLSQGDGEWGGGVDKGPEIFRGTSGTTSPSLSAWQQQNDYIGSSPGQAGNSPVYSSINRRIYSLRAPLNTFIVYHQPGRALQTPSTESNRSFLRGQEGGGLTLATRRVWNIGNARSHIDKQRFTSVHTNTQYHSVRK